MNGLHVATIALYPDAGHIGPLLKISAMLVSRGHRVTCLLPDECSALAYSYGFTDPGIGPALSSAAVDARHAFGGDTILGAAFDVRHRDYYLAIFTRAVDMVSAIIHRLRPFPLDLILVDNHQFPEVLAGIGAELDVPVLFHDSTGGLHSRTGPLVTSLYGKRVPRWRETGVLICGALYRLYCEATQRRRSRRAGLHEAVEEARRGLAAVLTKRPPTPRAHRAPTSAGAVSEASRDMKWHFATGLGLLEHRARSVALLPDRHVFGPILDAPQHALPSALEQWLDEQADRSVVYVSFGTMVSLSARRLRTLVSALGSLDTPVMWALGGTDRLPAQLSVPPTVRVESFLSQPSLLGHRAIGVCVTHGGIGTILECMAASVPMVVMPVMWDQPYNAQLVHDLGSGIRVDWWRLKVRRLREAIQEAQHSPDIRRRVTALALELRAQGASQELLHFFEQVVTVERQARARITSVP